MKNYISIEDAIDDFYQNNNIPRNLYLSVENVAYQNYKPWDYFIGEDVFQKRVTDWLQTFDNNDINIFLNLLGNYTYLTEREVEHKLSILSQNIEDVLRINNINFSEAMFITIPSPKGVKSGGDNLRAHFSKVNIKRMISNTQLVSSIDLVDFSLFKDKKAMIFIDDIIASGKTMCSAIKKFVYKASVVNPGLPYEIFFTGMVMSDSAKQFILKRCLEDNIYVKPIICDKPNKSLRGGYIFDGNEIQHVKQVITDYEKFIDSFQCKSSSKEYYLGFDKCKLSISFYYNTPNNTLCNFWEFSDTHKPLFERISSPRLIINDLKNRKSSTEINAYLLGKMKNETI